MATPMPAVEEVAEDVRSENESVRNENEAAEEVRRKYEVVEEVRRENEPTEERSENEVAEEVRNENEAAGVRRENEVAEEVRIENEGVGVRIENEATGVRRENEVAEEVRTEKEPAEEVRREKERAEKIRREGERAEEVRRENERAEERRRKKKEKKWKVPDESEENISRWTALKRWMGCGSSLDAMYDDPMPVVVFGSTGLVGGAVARALLRDRRFQVKAVTRTPTTDVARKLAEEGAIIVTADLNDPRSLKRAMEGAHAVFLTTHYWEHMNHDKEVAQGKNAVDAAVNAGVAHFVFYGSESPKDTIDKACGYMDAKAAIEKHVKETTLPYTSLRLPFYYENFLGIFKPHKVKPGVYAVAIPMEDTPLDCMSAKDVGRCVVSVLLRPKAHLCRELPLTAEKLTVQQITDCFNKHFNDRKFICPKIRVKDYEKFGFAGAADIAAMFAFYQSGQEPRDIKATRRVQGSLCSFDRWVADNKEKLTEAMTE